MPQNDSNNGSPGRRPKLVTSEGWAWIAALGSTLVGQHTSIRNATLGECLMADLFRMTVKHYNNIGTLSLKGESVRLLGWSTKGVIGCIKKKKVKKKGDSHTLKSCDECAGLPHCGFPGCTA